MIRPRFFDLQSSGDPVLLQHLVWLFGYPETWITLLIWIFCLLGALKAGRRLWRQRRYRWFGAFAISSLVLFAGYLWLLSATFEAFVSGEVSDFIVFVPPIANMAILILGIASAIWIATDFVKRRKR